MSTDTERPLESGAEEPERRGVVARVARWSAQHRRTVIIGWVALLVVTLGISGALGTKYSNNFSLGGTDSQRAKSCLNASVPGAEVTIV